MYVLLNKEIYSLALYIVVLLGPMGDQYYSEWVTLLSSIYVHNFICIYLIIINILLLLLLFSKNATIKISIIPASRVYRIACTLKLRILEGFPPWLAFYLTLQAVLTSQKQ